jgi:predicted  nucleic acid-binding Zn-ribbon protein
MTAPGPILRDLHRLRRHAKNLADEIERLPRQINAQKGKLARAEETQRQAQEAIKKLKVTNTDKEKTLKAKFIDVSKYEKQRDEAAGKKEYDALQHEIAAARQACQQLEDEILAGIMEADEKTAQLPELDKAIKQAKHELDNFDKISAERKKELTGELDRTQAQIKEIDATLPDDVRVQYTRYVTARGEDAMAAVENKICQACYTGITAQQSNELLQGMFVLCKSCGRILYTKE